ncbi:Gfo/Idh/MocA family protein, partial [Singulisphaera rosea]
LETHRGSENSWRFDPKVSGGGILADAGDHLIDALLWSTGQTAVEAAAVQHRLAPGLDLVTAAAIQLADGTPVSLAISGVSGAHLFEVTYFGENGRLRVTETSLSEEVGGGSVSNISLPESSESVDGNFVAALTREAALCCPAEEALETVRLHDAIARSAATGQLVRLA